MRKMNNILKGLLCLTLGASIFASCNKEPEFNTVIEGLPASLKLTFTVPVFEDAPVTKADAKTETQVQQLALIFYHQNNTSHPQYVKIINNIGNGQIGGSNTNLTYEITIPESEGLVSGKYYLYAVANWGSAFCHIGEGQGSPDIFENMSLDDLKNHVISRIEGNNQLDIVGTVAMSGKFGDWNGNGAIELQPAGNDFTAGDQRIHLRRVAAKIEFNFNAAPGITFKPTSYNIYNYAQSSTLMERSGWGSSFTDPGTLTTEDGKTYRDFIDHSFTDATPNAFTFYMQENVQIAKEGFTDVAMREKRESADANANFKYASDRSTYVVVKGSYSGPLSTNTSVAGHDKHVEGDVAYIIQLGNFNTKTGAAVPGSADNFTIRRNAHYKYNVTINGVNSIATEAQIESFDEEPRPGAEGDLISLGDNALLINLDAHYEKVLLKIPVANLSHPTFFVKTPYSNTQEGTGIDGTATEIPAGSKDCDWIQFSKPREENGEITFGWYSEDSNGGVKNVNIYGLLKEMRDNASGTTYTDGAHYIVRDGYVYTTAFVDEYFYDTNPETNGKANLSEFINQPDRVMNICTTKHISADGKSTYVEGTVILFRQHAINTIYPLDENGDDYVPFGIEKSNEWPEMARSTLPNGGYIDALTVSEGWKNTRYLVDNYVGRTPGDYGITEAGYKFTGATGTAGYQTPEYNWVAFGDSSKVYRPSGAVLTRNRDLNDDGIIDESEMKWYIPARDQCVALWMGNNDLGEYRPYNANGLDSKNENQVKGPDGLIHTSSGGMNRVWWAIEGCSFGDQKEAYDMRAIRNLTSDPQKIKDVPTTFSSYENYVFTMHRLGDNCLRGSLKTGEYSARHTERMVDNRLPAGFEMAKNDLVVTVEAKEGDSYCPNVTIGTVSGEGTTGAVTLTVPLTITRDSGHRYYANSSSSLDGATEITGDSYTGTAEGTGEESGLFGSTYTFTPTQNIYIIADNGNYVEIIPNVTRDWRGSYSYSATAQPGTVIDSNQPVEGITKDTFTVDEIKALTGLAAANYTQDADGKDKGQWRVPNQRELALIMAYTSNGTINTSLNNIDSDAFYASSTFFTAGVSAGKDVPYHARLVNSSGSFMTLGTGPEHTTYRIRPVRDVRVKTASEYDSKYSNSGTGFGIQ